MAEWSKAADLGSVIASALKIGGSSPSSFVLTEAATAESYAQARLRAGPVWSSGMILV